MPLFFGLSTLRLNFIKLSEDILFGEVICLTCVLVYVTF